MWENFTFGDFNFTLGDWDMSPVEFNTAEVNSAFKELIAGTFGNPLIFAVLVASIVAFYVWRIRNSYRDALLLGSSTLFLLILYFAESYKWVIFAFFVVFSIVAVRIYRMING